MTTQSKFKSKHGGESQCARIAAYLEKRRGQWIPMPELAVEGGGRSPNGFCMVHSRVADLRKRGLKIEQSNTWQDGQCHSFYKLDAQNGQQQ